MLQKTPPESLPEDHEADSCFLTAAEQAQLRHNTDAEPGIRRKGAGKGVFFVGPDGQKIRDMETIARIRALVIPPAWTDVWISPDEDGHIQATGRDVKGRKQYRYHARWSACRDDVKFSSLVAFAEALPMLRHQVDLDLRLRGIPREKVLASVVWLLDNTMIRVGNSVYAKENKSFGLTTLRDKHVAIDGAKLRFQFKGKSGQQWRIQLTDRRIAKVVKQAQDLPGQHLFQYVDENGERRGVRSQDVNDYLRAASGVNFSSKHFRTWGGTVRAASVFAAMPLPDTKKAINRALNEGVDRVAAKLGNTRAVCRRCYIHPLVLESWLEGRLADELQAAARDASRMPDGLDDEEKLVTAWLASHGRESKEAEEHADKLAA